MAFRGVPVRACHAGHPRDGCGTLRNALVTQVYAFQQPNGLRFGSRWGSETVSQRFDVRVRCGHDADACRGMCAGSAMASLRRGDGIGVRANSEISGCSTWAQGRAAIEAWRYFWRYIAQCHHET